ncbi:hypothetical protein GCM10023321_37300 [Pseudonocardia eucalypti]|uniref:Short subunit dehydrogenase n=2 Tax=Pseudonocardia eucalypti TaxID=648755 RepID=A0ABP9QA16_9PSEU
MALLAPVLVTRAALPHLRAAGALHGHAALVRFGEAMRRELYGSGVHVASVYPGPVDTPMMATTRAGADLGYALRPVDQVAAEILAGLEERRIDINTQLPERREMEYLNARDPLALDAALAPKLGALRAAVSTHRGI